LYPGNNDEASGSAAVAYVKSKGFPSKKILLGVPVYGRSFLGARGAGHQYNGQGGEEGTFEYKELPRPGAQEFVDTGRVAASCVGGDGGFVSYDTPETVRLKGEFCKTQQLGVSHIISDSWITTHAGRVSFTGLVQQMHEDLEV